MVLLLVIILFLSTNSIFELSSDHFNLCYCFKVFILVLILQFSPLFDFLRHHSTNHAILPLLTPPFHLWRQMGLPWENEWIFPNSSNLASANEWWRQQWNGCKYTIVTKMKGLILSVSPNVLIFQIISFQCSDNRSFRSLVIEIVTGLSREMITALSYGLSLLWTTSYSGLKQRGKG